MKKKPLTISDRLAQEMRAYLGRQPYDDVAPLLGELIKEITPQLNARQVASLPRPATPEAQPPTA